MNLSRNLRPYLIWGCTASFYIYQFCLRISPSLILDDLMAYFQVDASGVASISALSMYAYSLLQIPAGLFVDRHGTRKTILISISLCILGVSLWIASPYLWVAKLGRVLLGMGSASAFLCAAQASSHCFPPQIRGIFMGLTLAAGTIGAYVGNVALSQALEVFSWRQSLLATHVLGIAVFLLSFWVIPKQLSTPDASAPTSSSSGLWASFSKVIRNKTAWRYSWVALGIYLCICVVADLWGVTFIMQAYSMSKPEASKLVSLIYVGLCIGSLGLAILAERFRIRDSLIRVSVFALFLLSCLLFYWTSLPLPALASILFLIGFFGGAEMLCFSSLSEVVDKELIGTATGFMNCIVMLGGAFVAEQVGRLLDFFWTGQFLESGVRLYSILEFQKALSAATVVLFLSVLGALFLPRASSHHSLKSEA